MKVTLAKALKERSRLAGRLKRNFEILSQENSKISGSSFVDNIAEMVGSKKMHDRSIIVDMGESSVSVEVSINLLYGVQLPKVAAAVQEAVAKEITKLTGLKVARINIIVREIEDPADESEE